MCGIVGKICFHENTQFQDIKRLCDKLISRGPDAEGIYVDGKVGLGHRRLSIIDLESGGQPMLDAAQNIILVFNGEIYNFLELRSQLIREGSVFHTNSDTEVIINAYLAYGIDKTLSLLEGMFAFALYDKRKDTTYIARDKFGEKPLYYISNKDHFIFASELKALEDEIEKKEIDTEAMNLFFSLTYIPAPRTIYRSIKKIMPATWFEIKGTGVISEFAYYDLIERLEQMAPITDFGKAKWQLEFLLTNSVRQRMISDVPIGSFLSGGIDSSIVSTIMSEISSDPINTFSIGFTEKEYDESERAKIVADKIKSNHTLQFLDYKDVVNMIDEIVLYYDEPFGDSSALPTFYVAQLARKKVTVVLTGDCADELFGGYEKYLANHYVKIYNYIPKTLQFFVKKLINAIPHNRLTNAKLRRIKKVINNAELSSFDLHYQMMCLGVNDEDRKNLLEDGKFVDVKPLIKKRYEKYRKGNDDEKGYYVDLTTVLEGDMLVKLDRICMKNSLEARVPFLDSKIVEFAYKIPPHFKIKELNKKFILKETFKRYLPEATINYKKQGFGVPVDYWLKNQLKADLAELIEPRLIERQGLFNYETIKTWFDEHMSGKENHKGKLWNLYVFQKWYMSKMK
jgi:asparagine synthase (glutamine-hydrolysing)